MKSFKLLACLVALQFTCSLTLQAADPQQFRKWTDTSGRTMTAKLLSVPDHTWVKIQRGDGKVFNVAVAMFSDADQEYVKAYRDKKTVSDPQQDAVAPVVIAADGTRLKEPESSTWVLLDSGGSQPASIYNSVHLDKIIEGVNRRFAEKAVKTGVGLPLKVRTEPADLATRIQITGNMPDMTLAGFVREIARVNDLAVKTDAAGMVVLMDKPVPASAKPTASLFGVAVNIP
ncbi:MAG: SHD1 domain-containing protein [Opitutaceae bacterium]|jgi:hypothetical protein